MKAHCSVLLGKHLSLECTPRNPCCFGKAWAEMWSWFIPVGKGFQHLQRLCVFLQSLTTGWLLYVITSISSAFPPFGWIPPIPGEGKEQMG